MVLYAVSPADQIHGYNFEYFRSCKCILVLVSGELLDMLQLHLNLQEALQKLFHPPQRVVALLCGVMDEDVIRDMFEDWPRWRKVSADDEPRVYISAILESVTESMRKVITRHRNTNIYHASPVFSVLNEIHLNFSHFAPTGLETRQTTGSGRDKQEFL